MVDAERQRGELDGAARWLRAPAALMGAWLLAVAAAQLARPTEGVWGGGDFFAGDNGRGGAMLHALAALLAGWPALASTATLTGGTWWLGPGRGLFFGGIGWAFGLISLLFHGAALLAHGPGGLLTYFGSWGFFTFSDPRCDLDAHYGDHFEKQLNEYAMAAGGTVALVNCCLLYSLKGKAAAAVHKPSKAGKAAKAAAQKAKAH